MAKCVVDTKNMLANIERQNGLVMAEKVMIELVDGGIPRDEAHETIHLREICANLEDITSRFTAEQIEAMFNPANHIGVSGELVDEAVAFARLRFHRIKPKPAKIGCRL